MQISTPDWVKHAIFYQIFPDRFAFRLHPSLPSQVQWEPWHSPPTLQGYKGGNLWGIIDRLDYLSDLGITALYLTPIFQSACNHRYHTHDYYQVDPILGGNEALSALLTAAHDRQIKVVLDGVFNHASRGFFFFNDILENGPHSPWVDWFRVEGWPVAAYEGDKTANYVGWSGNRALPQFNHDHPDVREYIMRVAEYWVQQGIDGWRLDVPNEVKVPGFWQEFRDRVKRINPEAYIVGEIWDNAQPWLAGDQFDGVMNYQFRQATIAFAAGSRVDLAYTTQPAYAPSPALQASDYAGRIQELLSWYPWDIQLTQLNLLSSHDTARLWSMVHQDTPSIVLSNLLLFTFPGAPCIYYGDEVGLPGGIDPDCRRSFPNEADWDLDLQALHQQLIQLRQTYPALRTGDYQVLKATKEGYVFSRCLEDEMLIVAVNTSSQAISITLDLKLLLHPVSTLEPIYGNAQISPCTATAPLQEVTLRLFPRQGSILSALTSVN
ncbi:glycoside hydrolase family 13 protein [Acaryochloris sp. IP29b_bin.137]|uniref:glycoside hydrolase family 13 protein n=1 Tax=Acaryochloris sp. IP29b_bin.137 TaxID=2969217 RepID=UPI0026288F19|nr:glycoside hydrolase family 13 protein [Acaryochloris sp. IP29b_bin.137]